MERKFGGAVDSIIPASNDAIFYCAVAGKPLA
jgi:hypothetical protein